MKGVTMTHPRIPGYCLLLALVLCLGFLCQTTITHARTWLVPGEAPTIAAALDSATAGDVVELACGTYYEHDLVLKAGVTVRSESGDPDCATIDAQSQGRVFLAEDLSTQTALHGLTLTGGLVPGIDGAGGGILASSSSLRVLLCRLEGNEAGYNGGGISASGSDLLIYSSELRSNVAQGGSGGAVDLANCTGEFFNSRFEANVAVDGAGARLSQSSLLINWCTFFANEAQFFGGALFLVTESDPDIIHNSFVANSAYLGAGMMLADRSVPTVEVNIIAFNQVGAGIEVHDVNSGLNNFRCNDVHGNEDGGYSGFIDDQTGLNGNLDLDPLFCDLADGDLSLDVASPCLPLNNDCTSLIGAHVEGCALSPVEEVPEKTVTLAQNQPNPFNPLTTIVFTLARPGWVDLRVYDLAGRLVTLLQQGKVAAGYHSVPWNGTDRIGRTVPSGTYVYRLEASGQVLSRTMMLVR
jgi:hypothetical protein